MTSDKIRPHHLDRKAILYVRQSSAHQVLHNGESRALQYAMRERLQALGWAEIEIPLPGAPSGRQRVTIQSANGKPFSAMHYWVYPQ